MMTTFNNQLSKFLEIWASSSKPNFRDIMKGLFFQVKKFTLYNFSHSWKPKDYSNGSFLLLMLHPPIYLVSYGKWRIFRNTTQNSLWYCGFHIQNISHKVHGPRTVLIPAKEMFSPTSTWLSLVIQMKN